MVRKPERLHARSDRDLAVVVNVTHRMFATKSVGVKVMEVILVAHRGHPLEGPLTQPATAPNKARIRGLRY